MTSIYLVQTSSNRRQHWCWEHKLCASHLSRNFRPVPVTMNRKHGRLEALPCCNSTACYCVHLKQISFLIKDDAWTYSTMFHGGFNLIVIGHQHIRGIWRYFRTYWSRKRVYVGCPLRMLKLQLFQIDWNLPRNRTSYDIVDLHPLPDNNLKTR